LDEPLGYPDGLNAYTVEINSPADDVDPMGLKHGTQGTMTSGDNAIIMNTFSLDVWSYGEEAKGVYKNAIDVTIMVEPRDLGVPGKRAKVWVWMIIAEGTGYQAMTNAVNPGGGDLEKNKGNGAFVFDGSALPWDTGQTVEPNFPDDEHPHSAVAVKVLDLPECPVGEQKGSHHIWLWAKQDTSRDDEITNIMQMYRLEWKYEYNKDGTLKTPFTATITQVGNDPGGNVAVPPQFHPPANGNPWPKPKK
jgi:hypothetical protein